MMQLHAAIFATTLTALTLGASAQRVAFDPAGAVPANRDRAAESVIATHAVRPRHDDLRALHAQDTVIIPLGPAESVEGVVQHVDRRSDHSYSIFGSFDDGGQFILVVQHDAMAARIRTGERAYDIRYVADGVHLVQRLDTTKVEMCGGSPAPRADGFIPGPDADPMADLTDVLRELMSEDDTEEEDIELVGTCPNDLGEIVDVMVPYTANARAEAGGTNAIVALAYLGVDTVNIGLQNSAIPNMRMRLVWYGETGYSDIGTPLGDILDDLTYTGGGMDELFTIRNDFAADYVALLCSETAPGGSGLAWCTPTAPFSVTEWSAVAADVFAHEVGHNFGCAHDADNVDCSGGSGDARGWRWTGTDNVLYRSIMAYPPGTATLHYSNPDVFHMGQPTGVHNVADNAEEIDGARFTAVNHRVSKFDFWVHFDELFLGNGSHSDPFKFLSLAVDALPDLTGLDLPELPEFHMMPATTSETIVIDKAVVLNACGGPVVIGLQ